MRKLLRRRLRPQPSGTLQDEGEPFVAPDAAPGDDAEPLPDPPEVGDDDEDADPGEDDADPETPACPAAQICGSDCCQPQAAQICFANACVVPGDPCFSAADCLDGQYCEPGLGDPMDIEPPAKDPGACLQPPPPPGKCLDLPPPCAPEKEPPPDGSCIPPCEYFPEAGLLTVEQKWRWGPVAAEFENHTDVWATPTVGRLTDSNCDGKIDTLDPPNVIFVSGDSEKTCCSCGGKNRCKKGVLRSLDGASGVEIWSLGVAKEGSKGFAGLSVALGDTDHNGVADILAVTGEGKIAVVNGNGTVQALSEESLPETGHQSFGWGGGLAVADMDGDGSVDVAYASTVFEVADGVVTRLWTGTGAKGGGGNRALSTFADLDGAENGHQELLAGRTAYLSDGTQLWNNTSVGAGFPAVADFTGDGKPEAVLVAQGKVWVLDGPTGAVLLGPLSLAGGGDGGPPTVADFDGDGMPEIGAALKNFYSVAQPNAAGDALELLWQAANHDLSSSVTGSTVFDFDGDGSSEVIYGDECFLWIYDGKTGAVRWAHPTTSFTATEASIVADVDGDGHAEIVMVSNGANPGAGGWGCDVKPWNQPDEETGRPAWAPPEGEVAWCGITVFADQASSWVGTRTLWNQHTYHVTNICDDTDSACPPPNEYGSIPVTETPNASLAWTNTFRQNVQEEGIYDAPDATLQLSIQCTKPLTFMVLLRNLGAAILPGGVVVGLFASGAGEDGSDLPVGEVTSAVALFPGQVAVIGYEAEEALELDEDGLYVARVLIDPENPTFRECREDNNESNPATPACIGVTSP